VVILLPFAGLAALAAGSVLVIRGRRAKAHVSWLHQVTSAASGLHDLPRRDVDR
jgi:hypothetical protein